MTQQQEKKQDADEDSYSKRLPSKQASDGDGQKIKEFQPRIGPGKPTLKRD